MAWRADFRELDMPGIKEKASIPLAWGKSQGAFNYLRGGQIEDLPASESVSMTCALTSISDLSPVDNYWYLHENC